MNHSFRYLLSRLTRFTGLGFIGLCAVLANASIASAQVTTISATTLKAVKIARGADATVTNSASWVNLPGAVLNFTLQPGDSSLFVMRYTAESACYGGSGWCSVRILLNGAEASPVVGMDFAFDSTDGGTASAEGWKGHAVDRSAHFTNTSTKAQTITALVQYSVTDTSITARLDDWQFTVEQLE